MAGLTPEDEKIIDLKLENSEKRIERKMIDLQTPYNKKIDEIHQEIIGYGGRPGLSKKMECLEAKVEHHEIEINEIKENQKGKIETKKAVLGMIGSGGFVALLAWLSQFFGGKAP